MKERLSYKMSVRIYKEEKAFGPGIAMLLHKVEETGSLQKAASAMHMAYSKAWKMIREMEKQWGFALTERETGGRDGGGSQLTQRGKLLLEQYDAFIEKAKYEMDTIFERYFSEEWAERLNDIKLDEKSDTKKKEMKLDET